jgi:acetyltransferase-like isoleucine patch superfamily enzyme
MSFVTIPFGRTPQAKLLGMGLKIPHISGSHDLDARSFFEPPVFVQATLTTPTMVQIGAFASISGGRIGGAKIGRYAAIAPEVVIGTHEHPIDWLTCSRIPYFPIVHNWHEFCRPDKAQFIKENRKSFPQSSKITTIGEDVWIGQGAFIKSGVTLGTGCVIAARSVVAKDVPPYAVVAGVPAKVKKYRFDEKTIERLLALRWWRYSLYDCFEVPFNDIHEALDRLERLVGDGEIQEYAPETVTADHLRATFTEDASAASVVNL